MSVIIPEDLPDCIDNPIEEAITPVAKGIGKTLGDLWFLAMGGLSQLAEKKRIKYAAELDEFKKSLEKKVNAIPTENRVEPNTQIACQALEDAKYCADNKDVREMFANLIASTMNSELCNAVHPSYSIILKQMTSEDAKFFQNFIGNSNLPICRFKLQFDNRSFSTLIDYSYFAKKDAKREEVNSNALILSSLERLGIISLHFDSHIKHTELYQVYVDSDIFKNFKKLYSADEYKVVLVKGYADLTVLGKNLLDICCPTKKITVNITVPNSPTP